MPVRAKLGRNVLALSLVSFLTDVSSEMIYPLLPLFLAGTLGASAAAIGAIEGAAESVASLLKLASGWWSDRVRRRKPLVVAGYVLASLARPLIAIAQVPGHVLAIRLTDRVGKGIRTSPRDALIADSVDPTVRGRAFGVHRAADHAGAVVGPLLAFAALSWWHADVRTVFWLAAVPGALAVIVVMAGVKEARPAARDPLPAARYPLPATREGHAAVVSSAATGREPMPRRFWAFLLVVLLFTLGTSTDAFLLLRARDLGVPVAMIPVLWAALHVVKSASSAMFGGLSDRVGRRPLIITGWVLYALVYLAFGIATDAWHAWALFAGYGVFFGLTEGVEKALVADIVPVLRRGTAFGWYHLSIGLGALPASVIFGLMWQKAGPAAAFTLGATLALLAALGMTLLRLPPRPASTAVAG